MLLRTCFQLAWLPFSNAASAKLHRSNHEIISIIPQYVNAILCGEKTIELRKCIPPIRVGARLWIYATRPKAAIWATAQIKEIIKSNPEDLWQKYGAYAGIDSFIFKE